MNDSVTDGPARSAIAAAVRTNKPAPMIAPMPSATSANGPRVRFSPPSTVVAPSAMRRSMDFVRKSESATPFLLGGSHEMRWDPYSVRWSRARTALYAKVGQAVPHVNEGTSNREGFDFDQTP